VLDACRADLFKEVADVDTYDDYKTVRSLDSNTTPWTERNFAGGSYGDIVYVTANPVTSKVAPNAFHKLIEVWSDPDAHDGKTYTVPPTPVVEYAEQASSSYPNKRLIVHFDQPHFPFIPRPEMIYRTHWSDAEKIGVETKPPSPPHDVWEALKMAKEKRKDVWEGYKENLETVLPHAERLADNLPGKSVITSDHGNMLGKKTITGYPLYGHPPKFWRQELLEVPWAVLEDASRKRTVDDGVHSSASQDTELMEERLEALGYV
jgi:hypothetical protein